MTNLKAALYLEQKSLKVLHKGTSVNALEVTQSEGWAKATQPYPAVQDTHTQRWPKPQLETWWLTDHLTCLGERCDLETSTDTGS